MSKVLRVYDDTEHYGDFELSPEQETQLAPLLPMLNDPAMMAMIAPMLRPMLKAAIADKIASGEPLARDINVDTFDLHLEVLNSGSGVVD